MARQRSRSRRRSRDRIRNDDSDDGRHHDSSQKSHYNKRRHRHSHRSSSYNESGSESDSSRSRSRRRSKSKSSRDRGSTRGEKKDSSKHRGVTERQTYKGHATEKPKASLEYKQIEASVAGQPLSAVQRLPVDLSQHEIKQDTRFVWHKKLERDKKLRKESTATGVLPAGCEKPNPEDLELEIETLRMRRIEREHDRRLREEERITAQREADRVQFGDWQLREDEFQLRQTRSRAVLRLRENRTLPIDFLQLPLLFHLWNVHAKSLESEEGNINKENIATTLGFSLNQGTWNSSSKDSVNADDIGDFVYLRSPCDVLESLSPAQLRETLREIRILMMLDHGNVHSREYWRLVLLVACYLLIRASSFSSKQGAYTTENEKEEELNLDAVDAAASLLFIGSNSKKENKETDSPPDFWSLRNARVSPSVMHDIETSLSKSSKEALQDLEKSVAEKVNNAALADSKEREEAQVDYEYWIVMQNVIKVWISRAELNNFYKRLIPKHLEKHCSGKFQAAASHSAEHSSRPKWRRVGTDNLTNAEEDLQNQSTTESKKGSLNEADFDDLDDPEFRHLNLSPEDKDDADSGIQVREVELPSDVPRDWFNRYRPRKPRYSNRVNTGYEWNKYNQTHYDFDNPPPKVVQGYKFNIFYPDLVDRKRAPTYKVEPNPNSSGETVLLRFIAGPPYLDIAFEIVNREWELSRRRGFRCVFDRDVLQLHFHFKRYFYRK